MEKGDRFDYRGVATRPGLPAEHNVDGSFVVTSTGTDDAGDYALVEDARVGDEIPRGDGVEPHVYRIALPLVQEPAEPPAAPNDPVT